jgi:SAM-dependent MidA family methyltransferase
MIPWRTAWQDALYGPRGFYRRDEGPAGHFATSAQGPLGAVLAEIVARLAEREGLSHVVDLGCGRGELLTHLRSARPGLALTGVDVVERPPGIAEDTGWVVSPGGADLPDEMRGVLAERGPCLVVAHEWLDVVPCTIATLVASGELAEVLVDPATGDEAPGGSLHPDELAWCSRYWPAGGLVPGDRVEVGLARDLAWTGVLRALADAGGGVALAVDYGHRSGSRPAHGTLVGYRNGRLVEPVPDGSCDLTAHVALDSLDHDTVSTQRAALREADLGSGAPARDLARSDPAGYVRALAHRGALAALADPAGPGGFGWVRRRVIP